MSSSLACCCARCRPANHHFLLLYCSKAQAAVLRLRDIAKHLPPPLRDAVAEAVALDPPSPHKPSDSHAENLSVQQPTASAAILSATHSAASMSKFLQPHSSLSAAQSADAASQPKPVHQRPDVSAPGAIVRHIALAKCENAHLSAAQTGSRQLQAPAPKQAQHGSPAESAAPAWRNPAEMTPREVALEKLLAVKLSQPAWDQQASIGMASEQSGERSVAQSATASNQKSSSAQSVRLSAAVPALLLGGISSAACQQNIEGKVLQ